VPALIGHHDLRDVCERGEVVPKRRTVETRTPMQPDQDRIPPQPAAIHDPLLAEHLEVEASISGLDEHAPSDP
jgi:hypothetical protein